MPRRCACCSTGIDDRVDRGTSRAPRAGRQSRRGHRPAAADRVDRSSPTSRRTRIGVRPCPCGSRPSTPAICRGSTGWTEAIELLDDVLARCDADELTTRGRASLSLGLVRLVNEQGTASGTTSSCWSRPSSSFRAAGDIKDEAVALRALGFGVNFNRGAFEAASEQMGRVPPSCSARRTRPARCSSRSSPRSIATSVVSTRPTAHSTSRCRSDDGWATARRSATPHGSWPSSPASDAIERGVDRWTAEARAHAGGWIDAGAGVDYFAMVAEVLVQTGDREAALEHVEAAERHPAAGDYVWPARSARARFETVFGDPVVAERVLDELDSIAPPRERPLRLLTRAASARRRGDSDSCRAAAERSARARRARWAIHSVSNAVNPSCSPSSAAIRPETRCR